MIKRHVSVPIKQSPLSTIKSKTGLIERILNSELINSDIGLAQGLPISPTLANIIIKDGLENMEKELNIDVSMLCYADDISMYCGRDLYDKLGGDSFVSYLNSTWSFRRNGLTLDPEKSMWVKKGPELSKPSLTLLGLNWHFERRELSSKTRGRCATPWKKGNLPLIKSLSYPLNMSVLETLSNKSEIIQAYLRLHVKKSMMEGITGENILTHFNK